jgi:hypothetical protein
MTDSLSIKALDALLSYDEQENVIRHFIKKRTLYYVLYYDAEFVEGCYKPHVMTSLHLNKMECVDELLLLIQNYSDENGMFGGCNCDTGFESDLMEMTREDVREHMLEHGHYKCCANFELNSIQLNN